MDSFLFIFLYFEHCYWLLLPKTNLKRAPVLVFLTAESLVQFPSLRHATLRSVEWQREGQNWTIDFLQITTLMLWECFHLCENLFDIEQKQQANLSKR